MIQAAHQTEDFFIILELCKPLEKIKKNIEAKVRCIEYMLFSSKVGDLEIFSLAESSRAKIVYEFLSYAFISITVTIPVYRITIHHEQSKYGK